MRKKGLMLAVMAALLLAGCKGSEWPEAEPTKEVESQATEKDEEEESVGSLSSLVSYVDKSKQAADENIALTTKSAILIACAEAKAEGMEFPEEPIRFRYTKDLAELDNSYSLLKEKIVEILGGDGAMALCVEGNYMMVEIFKDEDGRVDVQVTLKNE